MSVNLTQPDYSQSKADPSATKVVTWIRSDGLRVLVNEDNPLPIGLLSGGTANLVGATIPVAQTAAPAIPATAKRWILVFRTAAGTVSYGNSYSDGVNLNITNIGNGICYSDSAQPATAISVTTDANTVCDALYSTT